MTEEGARETFDIDRVAGIVAGMNGPVSSSDCPFGVSFAEVSVGDVFEKGVRLIQDGE